MISFLLLSSESDPGISSYYLVLLCILLILVVAKPATNDQAKTQTVRPLQDSGAEVGDLGSHVKDRPKTYGDAYVALHTRDNHPQSSVRHSERLAS
jgi:hypothetical protein